MSAIKQNRSFWSYVARRLLRLYPALILCELIFTLINKSFWHVGGPIDYVHKYIYPTDYTFIRDIVPFYFLIYPLLLAKSARAYLAAMLVLTIPYLICYIADARLRFLRTGICRWARDRDICTTSHTSRSCCWEVGSASKTN